MKSYICAAISAVLLLSCKGRDAGGGGPGAAASQARGRPTWVDIKKLLGEYKDNEVRADAQFKGKMVATSGVVGDVKKDLLDEIYVTVGTGAQFEIPVVQCTVPKEQAGEASALSKGQRVTVHGRVDGLLMNVLVSDCVVNPVLQLCRRLEPVLGATRKCKAPDQQSSVEAASFVIGDGTESIVVLLTCAGASETPDQYYDRFMAKFGTEVGTAAVGSKAAACAAVLSRADKKNSAPVPDDMKAKAKAFFDAL